MSARAPRYRGDGQRRSDRLSIRIFPAMTRDLDRVVDAMRQRGLDTDRSEIVETSIYHTLGDTPEHIEGAIRRWRADSPY